MEKLLTFDLSRLWNSEYPLVVNRIIDIVLEHKPAELHLQRSFDRLAAFRPQLELITVQERSDIESAQLSELDHQRDTHYSILCAVTKAFRRSPNGWINERATRVHTVLEKHGGNIAGANNTAETQRLYNLEKDIAAQPTAVEGLGAMALTLTFEQMNAANKQFDTLFMSRNRRQAGEARIEIRPIRLECDQAVASLFNAIEYCMAEYADTSYTPLVNSLNNLSAYYRQQLAARATRRLEKKDTGKEPPITPPEE
jgi:hypothetical protein